MGTFWFFSGPWIARDVFTSENALKVRNIDTYFNNDKLALEAFNRIKEDVEAIHGKNRTQVLYDYIIGELSQTGEVYTQPVTTVGFGRFSNIYTYVRSKDGYGQECLLLAVPLEHNASIVYALTFVELMRTRKPDWQSKDLLVLFYPKSEYQTSIREFLDAYYGIDGNGNPLGSLQAHG